MSVLPFLAGLTLCAGLIAQVAPPALDVAAHRRSLRHGALLEQLGERLELAQDGPGKRAISTDLALVRLEAQLLQRVAPLDKLPGRQPAEIIDRLLALPRSAHEELTLARFAFFHGATRRGEDALARARDQDGELTEDTDEILAAARNQPVPRGGYHRYRGVWLPLAERNYTRALDDALASIAAVELGTPLVPFPPAADRPNVERFAALGEGVGERVLRDAAGRIRDSLAKDYSTVRSWLLSYASSPKLRQQMLDLRESMRIVQREAIALIGRCTKLDQPKVDEYRERLRVMHGDLQRLIDRDFARSNRFGAAAGWSLHERLRLREGALEAIDRFFEQAKSERLAVTEVRATPSSASTTAHLLPGRRMSGLEDVLWLLVKRNAGQTMDVLHRSADILRHRQRLTPWEILVLEILVADAIDDYNDRAAVSLDAVERDFVRILNGYRRTLGLQPFELEERLDVCSKKHSQEMVDLGYFGHVSPIPRNRTPSMRARLEGYNGAVGENCFVGNAAASAAFEACNDSPGHHRGLIGGGPHLGVGAVGPMWTMVAGGTDWTWRTLHSDMPPAERQRLRRVVDGFVSLNAVARGAPNDKQAAELRTRMDAIRSGLPAVLPYVSRVGFAAARDRSHPGFLAFPALLRVVVEAKVGTAWRPLQIAAVSAAIETLRFAQKSELRRQALELVKPYVREDFGYDPDATERERTSITAEIRKHWEDVAQWRFHAATDASPPVAPRVVGRTTDSPALDAPQRMLNRRERLRLAKQFGGGSKTELAVERGLAFLASVQDDDGAWRARSFALRLPKLKGNARIGNAEWEIAMTGLSLLAFSSAGYGAKEGEYADVVAKGARFLAGQIVDYGKFDTTSSHYMYNHALGTQALCEVYAYSADPHIGIAAQLAVDYLVFAQHANSGGWRYEANQHGDTSVTGWVVMALNSAFKAELDVSGFRGAMRFLDGVTQSPYYQVGYVNPFDSGVAGNRLTAVAMTARLFLGARSNDSRLVLPAYRLMDDLPAAKRTDYYYWYYATLALFQLGEPFWSKWNKALVPTILGQQDVKSTDGLRGSWPPIGPWSDHGGRIYQTTLAVLMLTSYYRYDRAPKVRLSPFTGDVAKAAMPMLEAILDDTDATQQRMAARKAVDQFGAALVGPIVAILQDGTTEKEHRRRLAALLVEIVERSHSAMLIALMSDKDTVVVMSALRAFERISSRGSLDVLVKSLAHPHRNARAFCAQSLARLGDIAAIPSIDARLQDEKDKWVRGELQKALHELGKRSALSELLKQALPVDAEGYLETVEGLVPLERDGLIAFVQALASSDAKLYERAIVAIRDHGHAACVPVLFVLMESPNLDARTRALRLLHAVTRKKFGFDPKGTARERRSALGKWRSWWKSASRGFGR